MAATSEIVNLFVYLVLIWLSQRERRHSRSRRRSVLAQWRPLDAFNDQQEENLRKILAAFAANQLFLSTLQLRSVWVKSRSQAFEFTTTSWSNLEWKRNFRVSKATFQHLCSELSGCVQRSSTVRAAIPVEKRVATALWRLGTNVEYKTISHLFGVGVLTACVIVHDLCKSIVDVFLTKYIKIPTGNQAMEIVRGFEATWGFPQCFGAVSHTGNNTSRKSN